MKKTDTELTYIHEDWEVGPNGLTFWGHMEDAGELLEHFYYTIALDFAITLMAETENDEAALIKCIIYAMHARGYQYFNIYDSKEEKYL